MQTAQTFTNTQYAFLAKPPPQKQKPTIPLPSPPAMPPSPPGSRRAHQIAAWAAHVQPGSPAPCSPHRRLSSSSSRRPSITIRRPSIGHSRAPCGSLATLITTPTSAQDIDINLSALGYTSVFVHVPPKTPSTPSALARRSPNTPFIPGQPSSPTKKTTRTMKRFRSLGILRSKTKATSRPLPSPTKPTSMTVRARAELVSKRKKAKYAHVRPPPPLANDIALMQFMDGGSVETNARRIMQDHARAAGNVGVSDVYRDDKGGIWWDQDEEMEYAHLLDGNVNGEESQWVKFGDAKNEDDNSPKTGLIDLAGSKRESMATLDSDLDPAYIVLPAEETQCGPENINLILSTPLTNYKSPAKAIVPGLSVLSLPSRPRRTAKHLRKPEFLIDVAAFGPRSPGIQTRISPKSPRFSSSNVHRTPRTPKSTRFSSSFITPPPPSSSPALNINGITKKEKVRRRPAPLKLNNSSLGNDGWKRVETGIRTGNALSEGMITSLPTCMDLATIVMDARREFVEASFAPKPVIHRVDQLGTTIDIDVNRVQNQPRLELSQKPRVPIGQHQQLRQQKERRKIVIASVDPRDKDLNLKEFGYGCGYLTEVDSNVGLGTGMEKALKKKKSGFGALFGRK